jgi:hypothetical protein
MPSHGAGDIIVLLITGANQWLAQANTNLTNNGFSQAINVFFGTAAAANAVNKQVWWKRQVSGTQGSVVIGDLGSFTLVRGISITGANTTLDPPFIVATRSTGATSPTTALDHPSVDAAYANNLVMLTHANDRDVASTTGYPGAALTNATLADITERMDNFVTAGAGGGIGMATANMVSSGATGNTTGTLPASNVWISSTFVWYGEPDPQAKPWARAVFI